jgi:hypothetical protein
MYTKDGEEADPYTELSVKGGTTTTFTAQWTELGEITITPVSMVAYVGGSSINGSHMPKLRYAVGTEDIDADLADLSFDIVTVSNGEILSTEHLDRTMINSDDDGLTTYCLFTQLTADMNGESNTVEGSNDTQIQRGNYIKLVDDDNNPDTYAGVYKIELRDGTYSEWDGWYITATDSNGNVYNVNLITVDENSDPYTVTIREVSAETNGTDTVEIYDNIGDYTAPVATEYKEDSTGFAAVVDETTTFATNGQDDLGVLVYDTDEDGNARRIPSTPITRPMLTSLCW